MTHEFARSRVVYMALTTGNYLFSDFLFPSVYKKKEKTIIWGMIQYLSFFCNKNMETEKNDLYLIPRLKDMPLYLGQAREMDQSLYPIDFPIPKVNKTDLVRYNLYPIQSYPEIIAPIGFDPSPNAIASLLFFSKISPHSISQIIFLSEKLPLAFLYSFFSAPIIEYMEFLKALKVLFSRIALPISKKFLIEIFKYAGRVMHDNGFLSEVSEEATIAIIIVCIFFSSMRLARSNINFVFFSEKCKQLADLTRLKPLTLERMYKELDQCPLPLFFTFSDPRFPPDCEKQGILFVKSGVMRLMKKRYFTIKKDLLIFAPAEDPDDFIGGVELDDIQFIAPAPKDKNQLSFMICGTKDQPIVFDIVKGKRMQTEKLSLTVYACSQEDLESWRSSIMHYSFRKVLSDILDQGSQQ